MIDDYTLKHCKKDREILGLKIRNLEHGINEAEKIIAESSMNDEALIFLRRKIAQRGWAKYHKYFPKNYMVFVPLDSQDNLDK